MFTCFQRYSSEFPQVNAISRDTRQRQRSAVLFRSPLNCVERRFLARSSPKEGRLFLQIGAGAGALDARTADGFTEFLRRQDLGDSDRVVLVEPNPVNVELLQQAWRGDPRVEIKQLAILPSGHSESTLSLWYALEDAPNFQCASHDREHVQTHFPGGTIKSFVTPALPVDTFIRTVRKDLALELLALDVESMDADILMSLDWNEFAFHSLSFESFHMGVMENEVRNRLCSFGYCAAGVGLDANGLDSLFIRPHSVRSSLQARMWELERKADLHHVDGKPLQSALYLLNWWRTRLVEERQ